MKRMTMLLLIFTAATKKTYAFTPDDAQIEYATGTILLFIVLIGICIYLMMRNSALKQELKRAEEQLQSFTDVVQTCAHRLNSYETAGETLTNDTLTNEGVGT
jgi:L-asparagine transporter-like permease